MNRQGPRLKNGVDLQLQSAFSDGNWQVAIRLADKRAKLLNDQYFQVVKICAESQLDDPTAKLAAVSAVWQYAKDGTVVKDVEAIDLLEWATQSLISEDDFVHTIGPLRVRAAKASPKDRNVVTRCLESCLLHWDLNSAQQVNDYFSTQMWSRPVFDAHNEFVKDVLANGGQIAAILDRSFPGDKDFLFWNIVITHMLASSSQSPAEKKKLYGTLAQKQVERAAQAAEQAESAPDGAAAKAPARRVQTEEEIILLYDIVEAHGTADDFEKLVSSAVFSPVSQFRQGRKELLLRAVDKYGRDGNWAAVFRLCRQCLSETDEKGQPTLLASDYFTWRHLISAATHLKDADPTVVDDVRNLLSQLLSSNRLRSMYRRNILLSRVSAAFELGPSVEEDMINGQPASLRLRELLHYIKDQATNTACFNDVKGFLERLDADGLRYLAYEHFPRLLSDFSDKVNAAWANVLSLKTQYFTLTRRFGPSSSAPQPKATTACPTSFTQLSKSAVKLFKSLEDSEDPAVANDIVPEIAILIASCSLAEAFGAQPDKRPLPPAARRSLFHAVLLLEDQLAKNPVHGQISLMLVQIHLFLGSAYRASEIWEAVGVKRTIVDSLAPIFYDRVSTVSPSLLSPNDEWGEYFREQLRTHYDASLKMKMPRRLIDAFESGSYGSVAEIPKYIEDLRTSCTRVMSLTESKRAERFLGLTTIDLLNDPRFDEVDDASRRCHLELLSETFHDLFLYKPPSVYKVSATSEAEQVFVIEMINRLSNSFSKFLNGPDSDFTPSEIVYFEALSLLSTLIALCTSIDRATFSPDSLDQLIEALKAALDTQRMSVPAQGAGVEHTVAMVGSMHSVSMLRDTIAAIKLSTQWLMGWNDRERERDRSGRSGLPKELAAGIKSLQATAEAAGREAQTLVARLKADILSRDFEPKLTRWIFHGKGEADTDDGVVGAISKDLVAEVVESWVMNVKGWGSVIW
ncbi:hypothetical protein ESCO_004545 [Escovopsis weberi]|uniref:Uncharacterized protein n=1 Tax=Escovopsis weberi TaxID=150374 RepID=A0A0M8N0W5_ESCWE|nr:hypothetical protein ESCO_004545 [Escovopsis weberi]